MSIENNASLITISQIKRRLKSADTDKLEIKSRLLNFVEQFKCLDHIARSVGLVGKKFSFVNRVSWDNILSSLTTVDSEIKDIELYDINEIVLQSSNELKDNIIPKLQHLRNRWMFNVILIEFVFFSLLTLMVAGISYVMGMWSLSNLSFSIEPLLYERPIFIFLASIFIFISLVLGHFNIRKFAAKQIVNSLNREVSEFDIAGAFMKNTRIQHSIFRPEIIGWNYLSRKCLLKN